MQGGIADQCGQSPSILVGAQISARLRRLRNGYRRIAQWNWAPTRAGVIGFRVCRDSWGQPRGATCCAPLSAGFSARNKLRPKEVLLVGAHPTRMHQGPGEGDWLIARFPHPFDYPLGARRLRAVTNDLRFGCTRRFIMRRWFPSSTPSLLKATSNTPFRP